MKGFITNKRLMLSLADAGGRMMYSIKDLSELAGYTSRVYSLIATLHRSDAHAYHISRPELYSLADIQGTLHTGYDGVRLEGVPIVAPALWPQGGEELLPELDVTIRPGEHMLISGPNGAGKTSIARLIAGIWPVYRGLVSRPRDDSIFFLPQRPYLAQGTLRDQVIYPHTEANMREAGFNDHKLLEVLREVKLEYLPSREGGWDTQKEWKDVLSGGEKQRISFARIIYHFPTFAVVDEPTSAVSSDVEGLLYELAKKKGITLITLSSRQALRKYHRFQLHLDGEGNWEMEAIGESEEQVEGLKGELESLKRKVEETEGLKKRLEEVQAELNKVWVVGREESLAESYEEVEKPESFKDEEKA